MVRRDGDIAAEVKRAVDPAKFDLTTAEGRADFDDALRAEIARLGGDDVTLKRHVGELIRPWRLRRFRWADRVIREREGDQ